MPAARRADGRGAGEPRRHLSPSPDLGELVVRAAEHDVGGAERRHRLVVLARALSMSARAAGVRAVTTGRWLTDVVADVAPRLPVRDRATLRAQHPGRSDAQIAESLLRAASLSTAAVGGVAGALAAVEFAAPPTLLAVPVQLAAETLAVAAIEIKLVAELHELYGQRAPGGTVQRGTAYLSSWVRQRAIDPVRGGGVAGVLGQAAKRELRSRLIGRLGRSAASLAPFLAGAVAGSEVNRRATRSLGEKLIAELRGRTDPERDD